MTPPVRLNTVSAGEFHGETGDGFIFMKPSFHVFQFQFVKTFKFVLRLKQTETTAGVVGATEQRGGGVSTNKVINQSNRKLFFIVLQQLFSTAEILILSEGAALQKLCMNAAGVQHFVPDSLIQPEQVRCWSFRRFRFSTTVTNSPFRTFICWLIHVASIQTLKPFKITDLYFSPTGRKHCSH